MTKILALDQSSSKTGIAVGNSRDDPRAYRIGLITIPKRENFGERLWFLFEALDKLIRAEEPDEIVYEAPVLMLQGGGGIAQQKFAPRSGFLAAEEVDAPKKGPHAFSPDVMMKLQKIAGTVEMIAAAHGVPCRSVVAASWRVTALGQGRAPPGSPPGYFKDAMMKRAQQLGHKPKDDNEADALGILMHALMGPDAAKRDQGDLLQMAGINL